MEQYYGKTTIIFDRPLDRLVGIDAMFYIVPRYLTKDDTMAPISPSFMEAVCELVKVIINKEQTDFSSANARMQDYDKMVVDIANKLALQAMNDEPVFVNGWVDSGVYGG